MYLLVSVAEETGSSLTLSKPLRQVFLCYSSIVQCSFGGGSIVADTLFIVTLIVYGWFCI